MHKHIREVRVIDLITYFCMTFLFLIGLWIFYFIFLMSKNWWLFLIICLVISYIVGKYFAIGLVLVYKAFAPMRIRDKCRFEPSCSTYMIMAINRYGLLRGVIKGIKRMFRCKPPNGGIDYP
jgi:putative membrane protein insertion efficiency factor